MWDYTDKVLDHFRHPRNVGRIEDADGVGEVGSLACGDAMRLFFKLDENRRLADVKFQTFGCASAIASASALTEIVKGMTIEEAERVTNQDIAAYLGGLPEQKMHCSVMGREALEAAIENFRTGRRARKTLDSRVVCTCFGVTEKEIEQVVRDNDLATVEQVTNYCKAGGGCGNCREDIAGIIARVRGVPGETRPERPPARRLTVLQRIRAIEETIEREVRPSLKEHGGDIELVDVDGSRVVVAFRGMCAQCKVAPFTMKDVVEARLREFVAPDLVVVEETGA